jgi:hypothetical protein
VFTTTNQAIITVELRRFKIFFHCTFREKKEATKRSFTNKRGKGGKRGGVSFQLRFCLMLNQDLRHKIDIDHQKNYWDIDIFLLMDKLDDLVNIVHHLHNNWSMDRQNFFDD